MIALEARTYSSLRRVLWRASYPYGHGEVVRFAPCPLEAAAAVLEAVAGLETGRMNMIRFLREHSTPKAHTAAMVG